MITIGEAIKRINTDAKYIIVNDKYNLDNAEITWLEGTAPISKEDIQAEMDSQ